MNKVKFAIPPLTLLLTLSIPSFLSSCSGHLEFRKTEGIAWNTAYHIIYESNHDLTDSVITVLNEIDNSLSPFNPKSVVSRINENSTDSVDIHFKKVYSESRRIHEESGGAFDPTLGPVIRAWGFGKDHEVQADTMRLDSLLTLVGIEKTDLRNFSLLKTNPDVEFNFSALAKGYGVDCIAEMLERNGVENYLVEVGGEIRAKGRNSKGDDWTIGIDRPFPDSQPGELQEVISITDAAIATSGNYRNYHQSEGKTFGHTISPVDGRPVQTDVISATVIASNCMEADALATCCMVIGSEKALSLCSRLGAGVFIIKSDLTVVKNDLFSGLK